MVRHRLGIYHLYSPPKIPELPPNLILFYSQNRANSDISDCKEAEEGARIGQQELGLGKPRAIVNCDR